MAFLNIFKSKKEKKASMRKKTILSLGSIAAILVLSGVITILEYRRMSDYVSNLISANINSITLSQKLSDITQEYHDQMLAVVIVDAITVMPDFDKERFMSESQALRNSITVESILPMVETVENSFVEFINNSMQFDAVYMADNVNTSEWFFGILQPSYNKFNSDLYALNSAIHAELEKNSQDFDAGFYRSIIPGLVSVCAGLLLILLSMYFILANYVNPIYKISDGIDAYRANGRRYNFTVEGDDHLANINAGVTEILEENIELKHRIKSIKEDR